MKLLLLAFYLFGGPSNHVTAPLHSFSSNELSISFSNHSREYKHADSVLVILDKFDRTGAGIVREIYYPDQHHNLSVKGMPEGKYYLTIQYLGIHHDFVEKVIHIRKGNSNSMTVKLENCEEFTKENISF